MKRLGQIILTLCSLCFAVTCVQAADMPAAAQDCVSCHQIEPTVGTEKVAPPLFYAGNKFQQEWLVQWLQSPRRIRPAGDFYANHITTNEGVDTIDTNSLEDHPAVDGETAQELSHWLMTLTPFAELIAESDDYEPGTVSPRLGAMDFVKFKGCGGCHRDTPEYGGLSAPELYTAWERLQPEFIVSYTSNPRAWDSHSAMPNRGLNKDQIHKLANYLRTLSAED